MAGDWIKMKRGLRHDPKVIAIARELSDRRDFMDWWSDPVRVTCARHVTEIVTFANVTRVTVCGLLDVWSALNNTLREDGKAPFMELQDIDDIAEIPGFGEAMVSVGWIKELDAGGLEFPNFSENNSPSKSRTGNAKSDAERAREYRARKKAEKEARDTVTASRHVTTEKRREEKSIKEKPTAKKAGENLPFDSEKFAESWGEWETYRAEIKKKLTPSTIKKQLNALSKLTETDAICTINLSIQHGWQGLFPERSGGHSGAARGNRNAAHNDRNAGTANAGRAADYADLG